MQIRNLKLYEWSKCGVYRAVNHSWWMSMLIQRRGHVAVAWLGCSLQFSGSGWMMTTARTELPYTCVSQAKSQGQSSRRGE